MSMPPILQWDPIYTVENGKRLFDLTQLLFYKVQKQKSSNFEMY